MIAYRNQYGFTLIEILVVIAIIAIITIWAMRINLSRLTEKQIVWIELLEIRTILEEIQNNAFLWKGVWENQSPADTWEVRISSENGWEIIWLYNLDGAELLYKNTTWNAKNNNRIMNLECQNYDWSQSTRISWTWGLVFDNELIRINSDECSTNQRVLFIRYGNENISESLRFNTLSWVIEIL